MNLSFLAPQFLYLLPAVALPLILHLISRNKSIDLVFPTIRFLKVGQVPKQQKRRVKDIFLLLLRTLLLAILILMLAQPQYTNTDTHKPEGKNAIIIDAGLIRFHSEYLTELKKALDLLQSKINSDNLKVYITTSTQNETLSKFNPNEIISKIKAFEPDYKEPNFQTTFKNAQNFLDNDHSQLFFITNLRRKNFQTIPLKPFSNNVSVELIDIPLSRSNINIADVQVLPVDEFKKYRVTCNIINEMNQNQTINLSLHGQQEVTKKAVDLLANQSTRVVFEINASESHSFYVQHDFNDAYPLDNIRYFRTPNKQIIKGLLVYDQKDFSSDRIFIEEALKINNDFLTPVETTLIEATSNDWSTVDNYQFIFILGCASKLTSEKIHKIKELVLNGSVLFSTPGENFQENIQSLNNNGLILQSTGPLVKSEYLSEPYFIESFNEESGLLKIFEKDPKALFSISIKKYIKLFTHSAAETLLSTNNRNPLLILNRIGKGLSFIFSFNLNTDWSALPVSPVFVPLTRELIQNSVAINDQKPIEIEPGDLIITKEEQVNHFNQNTIKTLTIAEQNNRTVASLGVYSANENSWVANPQPLRLDNNTVSQYEFQEKLVDKTKSGVFVSEDKPFDPSQYLAMLVVFFFIAELLFMKTNVTNKVLIK